MDETNYTYISTHTRTHTERVKRDGGQDEVTSPCYVTSPIAPQPCNLQLPAYSNPMSGRSVQLSERVPRCARDEYFRCERKTGKQTARTRLSSRPVAFIFYSDRRRRRRRRGFHRKRKIRGGNKGRSRRGIKLVYRPVENDSSGFNIPLFFFSFFFFIRRRDNSRKQEKREGRRKRIVEETVIKKLMRRPNSSPPSPSFFLFHFILFFFTTKGNPDLCIKARVAVFLNIQRILIKCKGATKPEGASSGGEFRTK